MDENVQRAVSVVHTSRFLGVHLPAEVSPSLCSVASLCAQKDLLGQTGGVAGP